MKNIEMNIILIEDDTQCCQDLVDNIIDFPELNIVEITNNAFQAIDLVQAINPDAIILDLELNEGQGNGIEFLNSLNELSLSYKPYILVTTNVTSAMTYNVVRQLGADFIMSKHQMDYSPKNVLNFLNMLNKMIVSHHIAINSESAQSSVSQPVFDIAQTVQRELYLIGISPKAVGRKYLADAIELAVKGESENLLSTLAHKYGKTAPSIQRAMQNAINRTWQIGDIDELYIHYTARIHSEKGVPTLMEFIHYYAEKITRQIKFNK